MLKKDTLIILIAPNVTEQMGGEGIKALQIFQEIRKLHSNTIQITHERNKKELSERLSISKVYYVADTKLAKLLWRSHILSWLLDAWFSYKAISLAEKIASTCGIKPGFVIIHQTEPNSPVTPRTISERYPNVFGPINGNIYYPRIFRRYESASTRFRRILHISAQRINRIFFRGLAKADFVLFAGGDRTKKSLLAAGCSPKILVEALDCGIRDRIIDRPRIQHHGINFRFVHFGRLVFHKGTALIIESLARARNPVCLDVIGRGPELERCRRLAETLGLSDRVCFLDWFTNHTELLDSFSKYRGALLPSIEDANGIVVQEAMAVGLPVICLDWGGPQLLIENEVSGYLIEPRSREHIVTQMAERLDQLSSDGYLAEKMSIAARNQAEEWRWSRVAGDWIKLYARLASSPSRRARR